MAVKEGVSLWTEDTKAEDKIKLLRLSKKVKGYQMIPLDRILVRESTCANTRVGGMWSQEAVERYAQDMIAGCRFPALVVMEAKAEDGEDWYDNLGGTHRQRSAGLAGLTEALCLVLSPLTPAQARFTRMALNQANGRCERPDDVAALAARHIVEYEPDKDLTQAAVQLGLAQSTLESHVRTEMTRKEAARHSIALASVSKDAVAAIATVKDPDARLHVMKAVAAAPKTPAADVQVLARDVNKSPAKAAALTQRWQAAFAPPAGHPAPGNLGGGQPGEVKVVRRYSLPPARMIRHLKETHACIRLHGSFKDFTPEQMKEFMTEFNELEALVNKLYRGRADTHPRDDEEAA